MIKRLLPFLLLLISAPAWATWTLVQTVKDATGCNSTTCAVTVSSTGSGNILAVGLLNSTNQTISSVTAGACSVSWVHPSSNSTALFVSADGAVDMYYCTSSVSGQTTITITASGTLSSGIGVVWELSCSNTPCALDTGTTPTGTINDSSNCTTCNGVALSLSGANVAIVAVAACGATCSGVGGSGWVNDLSNPSGDGVGHVLNVTTMNGTWSQPSSTLISAAMAFKESGGAAATPTAPKQSKLEQLDPGS